MPYIKQERRKLLNKTPLTQLREMNAGDLSYLLMNLALRANSDEEIIDEGFDCIQTYLSLNNPCWDTFANVDKAIHSAVVMLKVRGYVSTIPNRLTLLQEEYDKKILIPYEIEKERENGPIYEELETG